MIRRAPKTGGPPVTLVTGLGVRICAGPGGVHSIDRSGGPLHTAVRGDSGFVGVAVGTAPRLDDEYSETIRE